MMNCEHGVNLKFFCAGCFKEGCQQMTLKTGYGQPVAYLTKAVKSNINALETALITDGKVIALAIKTYNQALVSYVVAGKTPGANMNVASNKLLEARSKLMIAMQEVEKTVEAIHEYESQASFF